MRFEIVNCRGLAWRALVAAVAFGYLVAKPSFSQDIDPKAIREEDLEKYSQKKIAISNYIPSASRRANTLLEGYELVALGEFTTSPEPDEGPLAPRLVIATFRVDELFKGPKESREVSVELMSDMLAFRSENVSRYAKRKQLWKDMGAQEQSIKRERAALDESLRTGAIAQQEYDKKRDDLDQKEQNRVDTAVKLFSRRVAVIDGRSFYDLGGAIQPKEKYLLGLNRSQDRMDVFPLEEIPVNGNIYWSDTRDEIVAALRKLAK
ncbi:MAG: hypothetical protein ACRER3_11425 [Pseudomonas fluorescens]